MQTLLHTTAHMGCLNTLRESTLQADSRRKIILWATGESNIHQHCTWIFSLPLHQLRYPAPVGLFWAKINKKGDLKSVLGCQFLSIPLSLSFNKKCFACITHIVLNQWKKTEKPWFGNSPISTNRRVRQLELSILKYTHTHIQNIQIHQMPLKWKMQSNTCTAETYHSKKWQQQVLVKGTEPSAVSPLCSGGVVGLVVARIKTYCWTS